MWNYGSNVPIVESPKIGELPDRFFAKVEKTDLCWNWKGALFKGYGTMSFEGKTHKAHRLSYRHFKGAIPAGMVIDHICRNRSCVNPEHLRVVTPVENVMCGEGINTKNKNKTHCKNGHEFTPENTRLGRKGWRNCIACYDAANLHKSKPFLRKRVVELEAQLDSIRAEVEARDQIIALLVQVSRSVSWDAVKVIQEKVEAYRRATSQAGRGDI